MPTDDPVTFTLAREMMSTPELIIAWTGIIISVTGVIIAVIIVITSRKHNRLSFRPLLTSGFDSDNDGVYLRLANRGTGPATITKFDIHYQNKDANFNNPKEVNEFFSTELKERILNGSYSQKIIKPGFVLGANTEISIAAIQKKKPSLSKEDYASWLATLSEFSIRGEYESIYGENFSFSYGHRKEKDD